MLDGDNIKNVVISYCQLRSTGFSAAISGRPGVRGTSREILSKLIWGSQNK